MHIKPIQPRSESESKHLGGLKHVKDMPPADAPHSMLDEWQATALDGEESQTVTVPGRPSSLAGADGVTYTKTVADPRAPEEDVAVLELRGLYAHSEVELNGNLLGDNGRIEHDSYFRPLRIPFEPDEETEIRVTCHSPRDRFGGIHDTDIVPESRSVPGIWWDTSLSTHSLPYIESIDIQPELTETGATLNLRTTVVARESIDERITYSLRPAGDSKGRGMMERGTVETTEPGKTVVEHTVDVHDPALWWPRELGEQNRYELRAKFADDEHTVQTGICEISFEDGQLRANGEPMTVRGINLLTDEQEDIDRAIQCNANLVRAHAHVLPDELYERCDEEGILVWQDLPLTGPGSFNVDRGREIATALTRQYGRHPSLTAYAVHDDPTNGFPDGLGSGFVDSLRLRWRAWRQSYDDGPATAVAETFPDRRPVFPVVGDPGIDSEAASYYPGWEYGEPADIESLLQRYPASIVAEFGAGALAAERSDGENPAGFDAAKHDRRVSGSVTESQQYQATVLKTITEQLRQDGVGIIAFALRDTDTAGMGIFGADGSPKKAAEALERAYSPIQAFLTAPETGDSEIVIINETPRGRTVTVDWQAGEQTGTIELTVGAQGQATGGPIEIPADAEIVELTVGNEEWTITNRYEM